VLSKRRNRLSDSLFETLLLLEVNGFSSIFLKNLAPSISFPLMLIFDQSFQSGTIPDIWKTATASFQEGLQLCSK